MNNMKKRILAALLCLTMLFACLAGCGGNSGSGGSGEAADGGILKSVETFAYGSLDPHVDYYSWHSQKYGLTESLFRINENMEVEPWLAEDLVVDGNVATLTIKDGVCFSNGNPLTADMVKRNIERLAEVNSRFLYINDWTMEATDDKTLVITMATPLPTLKNELANPEFCMIDLDATTDFNNNPICTGPFKVEKFIPEGDITLVRNESYWGGEVILDGVTFYSMSDDQSKLMAMQNGEIDVYDNITATDIEIFSADPSQYELYSVDMQMRAYMFMNPDRIPESVREAITLVVDRESIASFMGGVMSPTYGVFDEDLPYGAVQQPQMDTDKAAEVMEADGYTLNADGVWEKNGQPLETIMLACFASRSIDSIAVLIREQLTNFGIPAEIELKEDPDGTYMTDHDYDICFYRMITDKTGDPMPFLEGVVESGSYQDITGFGNDETDALIDQLRYEADTTKRAELTNQIMQQFYDANVFCALVTYTRNTVMRPGVSGFSENIPYEYYGVTAQSTTAA